MNQCNPDLSSEKPLHAADVVNTLTTKVQRISDLLIGFIASPYPRLREYFGGAGAERLEEAEVREDCCEIMSAGRDKAVTFVNPKPK